MSSADLDLGSFTDDGPWEVRPDEMRWRVGIDRVRARTRAQVPQTIRRRAVPPGRRSAAVTARLVTALAGWAVRERRRGGAESRAGLSRRLRLAFEHLGPTYIKLGQIVSSGEGLFPPELVAEFRLCRDRVRPESWDDVRQVVEEELGRPLESVFARFDHEPIAAASIAQVHAATLRSGEEVVVKVQRPRVAQLVAADLRVMAWLAPWFVGRIPVAALANPPALVELFAETIAEELDFKLEAENMLDVARIVAEVGERRWVIPRPHPDLVTRRLLVMERLDGFAFDDVAGMTEAGVDTEQVVRTGMITFLEGAMLYGVFHGDLHGGNLLVREDGRIALLDYGITGRLDDAKRLAFLRLLLAATTNDVRGQLEALTTLGALPSDTDYDELIRDLGLDRPPVDPTTLSADELVSEISGVVKALLGYGARLPKELMLFIKDLVFLDGAIATLAPDLDIFAEIAEVATHMATRHGERLANEMGVEPDAMGFEVDLTGIKGSFGLTDETESLTYRDLQERRRLIRKRFEDRRGGRGG